MRPADPADVAAIAELLAPLEAEGILAPRSRVQLEADLPHFVVAEREAKVGITVAADGCSARRYANGLLLRSSRRTCLMPLRRSAAPVPSLSLQVCNSTCVT